MMPKVVRSTRASRYSICSLTALRIRGIFTYFAKPEFNEARTARASRPSRYSRSRGPVLRTLFSRPWRHRAYRARRAPVFGHRSRDAQVGRLHYSTALRGRLVRKAGFDVLASGAWIQAFRRE